MIVELFFITLLWELVIITFGLYLYAAFKVMLAVDGIVKDINTSYFKDIQDEESNHTN